MFNVRSLLFVALFCFVCAKQSDDYKFQWLLKVVNSLRDISPFSFVVDFGREITGIPLFGKGIVSPTSELKGTLKTVPLSDNHSKMEAKVSVDSAVIFCGNNGSSNEIKLGKSDIIFHINKLQGTRTTVPELNFTLTSLEHKFTSVKFNGRALNTYDREIFGRFLDIKLLPVFRMYLNLQMMDGYRNKINENLRSQLMINVYKTYIQDL